MAAEICSSTACSYTSAVKISDKSYFTDVINGNVYFTQPSDGTKPYYTVIITDQTNGQSLSINQAASGASEAFPGVFEAYNVDDCTKLPQSNGGVMSEDFQSIVSNPPNNNWGPVVLGGPPNCSWGVNFANGFVNLLFAS